MAYLAVLVLLCLRFLPVVFSSVVSVLGVGCVVRWTGCFEYVRVWNCVNVWECLLSKSVAAQRAKEKALPPDACRINCFYFVVQQNGCRHIGMMVEGTVCRHGRLTIILSQYVTHRVQVNKCVDF
uniref:Putative secreted protein n=1 Tax=Amblyomma americanum TaxID=6943 RepID=A0A0C9RWP2_AMBAM